MIKKILPNGFWAFREVSTFEPSILALINLLGQWWLLSASIGHEFLSLFLVLKPFIGSYLVYKYIVPKSNWEAIKGIWKGKNSI